MESDMQTSSMTARTMPKPICSLCVKRKGGDFSGRVTEYLRSNKIDKKARYYLCGNSEMINDVYDILSETGINGSNIVTEVFF